MKTDRLQKCVISLEATLQLRCEVAQSTRMWLFLSDHSRWVVQCILRLPPSAFESCARTVKMEEHV